MLVLGHRWAVNEGYARSNMPGRPYLHRILLGLQPGDRTQVDHEDRDRLNNRRSNLRVATIRQQRHNQRSRTGTSSHRGVSFYRRTGRWSAQVKLDGRKHHLGYFDHESDAAAAARAFRLANMSHAVD